MNIDDIISYAELVTAEGINLQKGMNFGIRKGYSVFLCWFVKMHLTLIRLIKKLEC